MCSLWGRRWQFLSDVADGFSAAPEPGPGRRWAFGVVLASVPLGLGVLSLYYAIAYSKTADWFAFALALLSAGASLHFHYFWASRRWSRGFGRLATRVSLVVLGASVVYLFVHGLL